MYKSFYGAMALDGMNFEINEGEIRCLIGENGCGKSTMIKVISGFHPFDSGELYINDKLYKKITPAESIAEGVQVIYRFFAVSQYDDCGKYNDVRYGGGRQDDRTVEKNPGKSGGNSSARSV